MKVQASTRRAEFIAGVRAISPLLIGSIPFAIIFGALAVTNGVSPMTAAAMSAFVFAGSAQFVAVGMLAAGADNWIIILTTLIVNLRHVLYAATLAPHMKHLSQRWLLPLGFWLTDESFMVAIQRYNQNDRSPLKHWFHLGTTALFYVNWQFFTYVGLWAGRAIPNPGGWGLDFAFPATFLGMLMPQLVSRSVVACVISAGTAAMLFNPLPHKLGLIIAAFCGVAAGIVVERWAPSPTAPEEELEHSGQSAYQRANKP
ncbi:MAG: AzlC family ABC transporter permease [Caldilineaceae bacterium]|nr:AzlC family ABC transporter permease [Caldilineaceae bacterium]